MDSRVCVFCRRDFEVNPHYRDQECCSPSCAAKYRPFKRAGIIPPLDGSRPCPKCGQIKMETPNPAWRDGWTVIDDSGEMGDEQWRWLFRNLPGLRDIGPLLQPGDSLQVEWTVRAEEPAP